MTIEWTKSGRHLTTGKEERYVGVFREFYWLAIKSDEDLLYLKGTVIEKIVGQVPLGYPIAWGKFQGFLPNPIYGMQFRFKNAEVYTYWMTDGSLLVCIARDPRKYKRLTEWRLPDWYKPGMKF